jgi:hypothetical protein
VERTIVGSFATRRDAETAVEHLVQEYGLERSDISIQAAGEQTALGLVPPVPILRAAIRELKSTALLN